MRVASAAAEPGGNSLPDIVYGQIRRAILTGEMPPGYVLRQEELAQKLGISRVPLREALRRLETEGIVVLRPRRGYAVVSLSPEEIREIFDLRAVIEAHAGEIAAQRRTDDDIAAVKASLEAMDRLAVNTPGKVDKWLDVHARFHSDLFASARRSHASRVVRTLGDLVEPYIRIEVLFTKDVIEAQREHHEMYQALVDGDGDRLRDLCKSHCLHTAQRLQRALDVSRRVGGSRSAPRLISP